MGSLQIQALKAVDRLVARTVYRWLLPRSRPGDRPHGREAAPAAQAPGAVLVIRPGGIGDAVLFYPMLQALREAWPGAQLHVLAEKRNAGLFKANDIIDRVFLYDVSGGAQLWRALRGKYDVVIDTEQYHYLSAIIAHATGAPILCGFDTRGKGGLYTHRVRYDDRTYEVYSFLDLARAVTGREHVFNPEAPFFPVRQDLLDRSRKKYGIENGSGTLVLQPGASILQRRWEPDKFRAVVEWALARGWKAILVGGASELPAARAISSGLPPDRILNLCGRIPLSETAAVVSLCDLYVGSDTGVLHIAYGVGTPTVHLFGSGVLEKWAPRGSRYQAISKNIPCSPCIRYNYVPPCPYDTECMRLITVEEVLAAAERATRG